MQAFLVAGGQDGPGSYLASVLTLLPEATDWTEVAPLPRALAHVQASIVGGRLRVTGGWDKVIEK